jgi:hypothetical protein
VQLFVIHAAQSGIRKTDVLLSLLLAAVGFADLLSRDHEDQR